MRTDRIIRRQSLKEQLASYKALMAESRPIIEAQRTMQKAFQAGFIKGMEAAKSSEPGLEPGANPTEECGPSNVQEETPVH